MSKQERNLKKFKKFWPYLAAIMILAAGLGVYQLLIPDPDTPSSENITTSTIRTGDIRVTAMGSGNLISAAEIKVGFEFGGVVEEVLVTLGDEVQEGQILALLEDEELLNNLSAAEAALRELTSDSAVAAAALEIAEAQKAVLSAESTLSFYLSPYVFKSEQRLREAQQELQDAEQDAVINPSTEAEQRIVDAQDAVDHATLSLEMNWETYYEEYVPDFFNFRWRDRFGFWHDYYDPPSETEVALVWAELAAAEARLIEAEIYLAALLESDIPEDAYGSQLVKLEDAAEMVSNAQEALDASKLVAPIDGVIITLKIQNLDSVGMENVVTIAELTLPTVEAFFDEGDWNLVKEGNPVEMIFDSLPEKVYLGQVVFVDPTLQIRQNTTTVSALVELDISITGWANLPLFSGAAVEVVAGEVEDAILIPIDGLQDDDGEKGVVLIIQDNGEITKREVELGLRDVLFVEITEGLSVGDVILIGNLE